MNRRGDIFCRVVDNFGDAGVCWRLARRLARDHGWQVRLWIDQPAALQAFLAPAADDQRLLAEQRIEILRWSADSEFGVPADLVIETFGCDLPASYAEALARRPVAVAWYNLEYLSAEDWVEGCHGLPSPHPRLPLSRTFFFPGFSAATGGLLREPDLLDRRLAAGTRPGLPPVCAAAELLGRQDGTPATRPADPATARPGPLRVGLFCYPQAPLTALLDALAATGQPVDCRVFQGPAQAQVRRWDAAHAGHALRLELLPWMGQDDFDRVLWACDFNLVRGEDSFVRAQWAGRPLLWDIYPQPDDAHLVKMAAFLRRYRAGLAAPAAAALGLLWQPWVRREPSQLAAGWAAVAAELPALRQHAEDWCRQLAQQPDLADALLAHARAAGVGGTPAGR